MSTLEYQTTALLHRTRAGCNIRAVLEEAIQKAVDLGMVMLVEFNDVFILCDANSTLDHLHNQWSTARESRTGRLIVGP